MKYCPDCDAILSDWHDECNLCLGELEDLDGDCSVCGDPLDDDSDDDFYAGVCSLCRGQA